MERPQPESGSAVALMAEIEERADRYRVPFGVVVFAAWLRGWSRADLVVAMRRLLVAVRF